MLRLLFLNSNHQNLLHMKTTKEKLKLIRDAFDALHWAFDSHNTNHADTLFSMCLAEERGHRKCGPDFARYHTADTISAHLAAKLFAVRRVAEYLTGEAMPAGKAYLHTQKSCFQAAAMVDEFKTEILEAWKAFDIAELASMDYSEFVKIRKDVA